MAKLEGDYLLHDILAIMSEDNVGALNFLFEVLSLQDENRFIKCVNSISIFIKKYIIFFLQFRLFCSIIIMVKL